MRLPSPFDPARMSVSRRERFAYWRAVPLSRLASLLTAVFFTFGSIGLLNSILSAARTPPLVALGWALLSGGFAVCYIIALARRPVLFALVGICQLAASIGYSVLSQATINRGWLSLSPERSLTLFCTALAIPSVVIGYAFFFVFIQKEGRQMVRAQTELTLAHGIQQTLVPPISISAAGCSIFGLSVPSEKVGGDVVDVVRSSDGSVSAYVADIAGHGLQAGILMGMVKTAARTVLLEDTSPALLFERLNRVMPDVKEAHMYATCAALHIHAAANGILCQIDYALAGHPPILHVGDGVVSRLSEEQYPLGLFPFATFTCKSLTCSPGDLLLIATDGVLEVAGKDGSEFGDKFLEELLLKESHGDLPALAQNILDAARACGPQLDDQTLLLVRVL